MLNAKEEIRKALASLLGIEIQRLSLLEPVAEL